MEKVLAFSLSVHFSRKQTKYHWVASSSRADYLTVDEMTFLSKEKQVTRHSPCLLLALTVLCRGGKRALGQYELTFTERSLSQSRVISLPEISYSILKPLEEICFIYVCIF